MAGSITAYETAAGKRYRVRYRKPDKSQTDKRGFRTKREAELFLASVTVSKATGEYIDPALGRTTITRLSVGWLAGKKTTLKPSTYRPMLSAWTKHVEPRWGDREISGVQPSEVQEWVAQLAENRSATTVARALGVLAGILDTAVADRRLARNPARGAKTPRKKPKPRVYLTHDQVHRLAAASAHPALLLTLAYTGLRWGEVSALRVRNVNELRRRLTVEENAVLSGAELHVGTPKTHRKRTVPYPVFLGRLLAAEARGKAPEALLFGDGVAHMRLPDSTGGWFAGAVRRVQAADERALEEAKARAAAEGRDDVALPSVLPRVTPHDLRHTAASLAISAGANVKAVQRMLGHASAAMTLDTYSDLFDDDLDAVADRLATAAREASVGKMWAKTVA